MWRFGPEILRFAIVGLIAFAIDGGLMQFLISVAGVPPLLARGVSFPSALSVGWALNRTWTFRAGRKRSPGSQYWRYLLVQMGGFLINYAAFAALVTSGGLWREWPLLALTTGAFISMLFTYGCSRLLVFSAQPSPK